jgi:NADH-quinone oxidoreductase subunit E
MEYIRVLEVATFYFMFQLQPVGSVAHIQVCGTLSCMICNAEDLISVCKDKIAPKAHQLSADGKFSWEEVECLGSCANAPMAQIGKDYYEDLTAEKLAEIIDEMAAGRVPVPGPQNGRYGSEPKSGLTSLKDHESGKHQYNASAQLAVDIGDTIKRIDGTEVPLLTPWNLSKTGGKPVRDDMMPPAGPDGTQGGRTASEAEAPRDRGDSSDGVAEAEGEAAGVQRKGKPKEGSVAPAAKTAVKAQSGVAVEPVAEEKPLTLTAPRGGKGDDLKRINGVGPKIEGILQELGFWHFDQIANWTPAEIAWVDSRLKFKGRIEREDWVNQAKGLVGA